MIVKTNIVGYVKDTKTNMVINTNQSEYDRFCAERNKVKHIRHVTDKVSQLEALVMQLIEKGNNN